MYDTGGIRTRIPVSDRPQTHALTALRLEASGYIFVCILIEGYVLIITLIILAVLLLHRKRSESQRSFILLTLFNLSSPRLV